MNWNSKNNERRCATQICALNETIMKKSSDLQLKRRRKSASANLKKITHKYKIHQWKCADESALRKGIYQFFLMWFVIFTFSLSLRCVSFFRVRTLGSIIMISHIWHRAIIMLYNFAKMYTVQMKQRKDKERERKRERKEWDGKALQKNYKTKLKLYQNCKEFQAVFIVFCVLVHRHRLYRIVLAGICDCVR